MKAICVGHSTYDITLPVDTYPKENVKYRVKNIVECGGGPASNGAYLLGKWGLDTMIISAVGDDYYGDKIYNEFASLGIDVTFLEKRSDIDTSLSFIIANKGNGKRTIFTSVKRPVRKLDIDIPISGDLILVDGQHPDTALNILENNFSAISVLDAGRVNEDVLKLGKKVTYVICSHDFAEEFTNKKIDIKNISGLVEIYDQLQGYFNNNVIITIEEHGSFTKIEGKFKLIPSIKVNSIDSTGAGDLFHGAFLYFIGKQYSIEESIRYASITAALSTMKVGARVSIPDLEEVLNYDNII